MQRHLRVIALRFCLSLLVTVPALGTAAQWRVEPGQSIQNTINDAAAGDQILIAPGFYQENIFIDKSLTLTGEIADGKRPTLSGGQRDDTIRVTATHVTIEHLIVRDSGDNLLKQNAGIYLHPGAHFATVRHCDLTYNLFGLWIEEADDAVIEYNRITGLRDYQSPRRGNGILLYFSQRAKVIGNDISFVRDGIYVDVSHNAVFRGNKLHHSRYGSHYMNSYHNLWEDNDSWMNRGGLALMEVRHQTIRNNRAWANSDHGIMLRTLHYATVENNVVAGNNRGFFIYDAELNTLKGNLVVDNIVGVHLAGSKNNKVDGNDFISNREQVRYVGGSDMPWGENQGNYWSNYRGWDRDGDGVGDVRYEASDIVDRLSWQHPMMKLLLNSPAVQSLSLAAQQFPLLRSPSVIDNQPRMQPYHTDWRQWLDHYYPGAR